MKTYYHDTSRPLGLAVKKRSDRDRFYLASRDWAAIEVKVSRLRSILSAAKASAQYSKPLFVSGEFSPTSIGGGELVEIHPDDLPAFIEALEKMESDL